MGPTHAAAGLDDLVADLRGRLLGTAGAPGAGDFRAAIRELVDAHAGILDERTREEIADRLIEESFGLRPLEPLIADPEVDEIMVCGLRPVWVERRGRLEPTPVRFESDASLRHAIERILSPVGRRVDESRPLADARLADGSRVNVVIPPLALDGPSLTIRRFRRRGHSPADLVANGTLDQPLLDLLADAVRSRLNLLVCGGTGSGKTTTLLALMAEVGLPHAAVREQVADALHLVVCQTRRADGRRRITSVAEVVRVAGGPGVRSLYEHREGDVPRRRTSGAATAGALEP